MERFARSEQAMAHAVMLAAGLAVMGLAACNAEAPNATAAPLDVQRLCRNADIRSAKETGRLQSILQLAEFHGEMISRSGPPPYSDPSLVDAQIGRAACQAIVDWWPIAEGAPRPLANEDAFEYHVSLA